MSASRLEEEVLELARALIRLDTSNPPGNETVAATLLADYLGAAGAECELAGPDPERLNLIARVRGSGEGPSTMLMAHTDVVPAPPADWTVPPFAAEVRDGHLVGRGAADMKGELAARAVAVATLARSGARPAGDVVLLAESDEENNTADVGISWLVREHSGVRCDYAINEGGGMLLELAGGARVMTIAVGEKQVCSLRIRVFGTAGHASVPAGVPNAVELAATTVARLAAHEAEARIDPALARALRAIGAPEGDAAAVAWAAGQHPQLAGLVPAMTRLTVTPTGLRTHEPANVIPPYADVICDCRALAGQTFDDIATHVAAALGPEIAYEIELLEPLEGGTESPIDTPLYRACERWLEGRLPGAQLLPIVSPGFSDSYWVRRAHGTVAYGFAPILATDPELYAGGMHGADESIAIADLCAMTEFNLHALGAVSGLGEAWSEREIEAGRSRPE